MRALITRGVASGRCTVGGSFWALPSHTLVAGPTLYPVLVPVALHMANPDAPLRACFQPLPYVSCGDCTRRTAPPGFCMRFTASLPFSTLSPRTPPPCTTCAAAWRARNGSSTTRCATSVVPYGGRRRAATRASCTTGRSATPTWGSGRRWARTCRPAFGRGVHWPQNAIPVGRCCCVT